MKGFIQRLVVHPVFWVALVLCTLAGFIVLFEYYARPAAVGELPVL